jgi:hypothetical protein
MNKSNLILRNVADIRLPSAKEYLMMERAYRRGYYHGAGDCFEYIENTPRRKLRTWLKTLYRWRCAPNVKGLKLPPAP